MGGSRVLAAADDNKTLTAHCCGKLPVVHPGQSALVWGQTQISAEIEIMP